MNLKIISDYKKAKRIFMTAMMYDDINRTSRGSSRLVRDIEKDESLV